MQHMLSYIWRDKCIFMVRIIVPTYKRPTELKSFFSRHSHFLTRNAINVHVFHNEPNPKYFPADGKLIKNHFNKVNQGITGNAVKLLRELSIYDEHLLITSDEEILDEDGFLNYFL